MTSSTLDLPDLDEIVTAGDPPCEVVRYVDGVCVGQCGSPSSARCDMRCQMCDNVTRPAFICPPCIDDCRAGRARCAVDHGTLVIRRWY